MQKDTVIDRKILEDHADEIIELFKQNNLEYVDDFDVNIMHEDDGMGCPCCYMNEHNLELVLHITWHCFVVIRVIPRHGKYVCVLTEPGMNKSDMDGISGCTLGDIIDMFKNNVARFDDMTDSMAKSMKADIDEIVAKQKALDASRGIIWRNNMDDIRNGYFGSH